MVKTRRNMAKYYANQRNSTSVEPEIITDSCEENVYETNNESDIKI